MTRKIFRQYLEIKSPKDIKEKIKPHFGYSVYKVKPKDFQLNKFFYKQIGNKYNWVDRLIWTDRHWIEYVSNENLLTFVLKYKEELCGYFELIIHKDKAEIEIAYFGLLEEYFGKKLGGYFLSEALKRSFLLSNIRRVWCHTCSLDHKNALKNYLSRGMNIFKTEIFKQ